MPSERGRCSVRSNALSGDDRSRQRTADPRWGQRGYDRHHPVAGPCPYGAGFRSAGRCRGPTRCGRGHDEPQRPQWRCANRAGPNQHSGRRFLYVHRRAARHLRDPGVWKTGEHRQQSGRVGIRLGAGHGGRGRYHRSHGACPTGTGGTRPRRARRRRRHAEAEPGPHLRETSGVRLGAARRRPVAVGHAPRLDVRGAEPVWIPSVAGRRGLPGLGPEADPPRRPRRDRYGARLPRQGRRRPRRGPHEARVVGRRPRHRSRRPSDRQLQHHRVRERRGPMEVPVSLHRDGSPEPGRRVPRARSALGGLLGRGHSARPG